MVQFSSLDELYYGLKRQIIASHDFLHIHYIYLVFSKSARFLAPKIGHADNFSRYSMAMLMEVLTSIY